MGGICSTKVNYDLTKIDFSFFVEERIIGKGGFGTVYAVRKKYGTSQENEIFFAVKELDKHCMSKVKGLPEMTINELQYMMAITEGFGTKGAQFLMNLECAFQSETSLYFVQDLMDGGDLHFNMIHRTRKKRFDLELVKFYSACCLLALEELHSLRILHRDIKPANLLLDKHGYVRLADFGLCGTMDKNGKLAELERLRSERPAKHKNERTAHSHQFLLTLHTPYNRQLLHKRGDPLLHEPRVKKQGPQLSAQHRPRLLRSRRDDVRHVHLP